jgi:tetratricopeptide (TPR) repeat protein
MTQGGEMKIQKVLVIVCALFLLITLGTALRAAETPGGQLPSAARVAFDEGMVAVGQQQWTVAIRNFLKAQKAAPEAPEVLFNLGLAESKVPGRELRAIAWFQAYLFAVPAAANAGAVRKEMVNLKVRVEGTLDKLINQAGRLAALESYPYSHYADIAVAQARAGDIAVAKRMAAKALNDKNSTFHVNDALSKISVIQYNAGDVAGAEDTIREIGPGGTRERPYGFQSSAYGFIAFLQAMDGAFSRAEATIERARSDGSKCPAYLFVAAKEALAGKKDQASSMITKALAIPMEDSSTYLGEIMTIQE